MPRLRVDQVMTFAWKFLFPLALLNAAITAVQVVVWSDGLPPWLIPVNIVIAIGLVAMLHKLIGFQGQTRQVVSGSSERLAALSRPVAGGSE